ncbi:MAG: S8 family serine peptidase, partial [bacterium]|nr:S8 family serine peptidase [bacterium]
RMTHEALDHVPVLAQWDFAGADSVVDWETGDAPSAHAHGTQVISTVVGYTPGSLVGPAYNASVILVRASDVSISSPIEEDWWVAGLEWAEVQGADLISSSLGFWTFYTASDLDGDTAAATIATDMAAARGLLVVNGCGNQGGTGFDVIVAPADADSMVAVGSTDVDGVIATHSSSG